MSRQTLYDQTRVGTLKTGYALVRRRIFDMIKKKKLHEIHIILVVQSRRDIPQTDRSVLVQDESVKRFIRNFASYSILST